jgi:CheY-like chemotaxis protein
MKHQLNRVLVIDDNDHSNFFTQMTLEESGYTRNIKIVQSGKQALEYLKATKDHNGDYPDLIFLDINMPGMDGWEFIEEYEKLDKELKSKIILVILATSDNPEHKTLAKTHDVITDFRTKPLTKAMWEDIMSKYF